MGWTGGQIALVVFLIFIFIVILFALLWFLLWRKPTPVNPDTCTADSNCISGYYCGGGGICVKGTSGGTAGSICSTDTQCEVGLLCQNGRCVGQIMPLTSSSTSDFASRIGANLGSGQLSGCQTDDCVSNSRRPIRSFSDSMFVANVSGERYYLEVTRTGSVWTTQKPSNRYSYSSNGILSSNGDPIAVNSSGELYITSSNENILIAPFNIIARKGRSYTMKDQLNRTLSVNNGIINTSDSFLTEVPTYFPGYMNAPRGDSHKVLFTITRI